MSKSSVYFFVVLTLLSLGLTLVPNAFSQTIQTSQISQTQDIKILSYSYYVDNTGTLDVVGEVQNDGPNTVAPVILAGSIIDSNGVDQDDSYTEIGVEPMTVPYLSSGQIAPFYMEFWAPNNSPDGTWATVSISKVELAVAEANATDSYQYPDLTVTSSSSSLGSTSSDKGVYWVTGNVENTGSQTAENVTVFGTFYNSTGCVVAVGYGATDANLPPSGTDAFKLGAFDINQTGIPTAEKITKYSLLIQADGPILQGTTPLVTPSSGSSSSPGSTGSTSSSSSPSSTGSPSPTQPPTVNSNSNKSSNPAVIIAIIVVLVLVAAAGTLLVLRKNKPHQTVKQAKKARKNQLV